MFNRTLRSAAALVLAGHAQAADSSASVEQVGDFNKAETTQSASTGIEFTLIRTGELNVAQSVQEGTDLAVAATQSGAENVLTTRRRKKASR